MTYLSEPVLLVENLSLTFPDANRASGHNVLSNLTFDLRKGEVLGIVGDSGSGKTMTALAVAGLLPENAEVTSGRIMFDGKDLLKLKPSDRRKLLGDKIGMIFQEPLSSFNPLMTIGKHLNEVLTSHSNPLLPKEHADGRKSRILEMLAHVSFTDPLRIYNAFPHQISGGQRQRALIAGTLLLKPTLLIADEPTTALDTVTQSQIVDQLKRISRSFNLSVLFISHDLMLVERICDRVAVMHNRRIVELETPKDILHSPTHPHTAKLIRSARAVRTPRDKQEINYSDDNPPLIQIKGLNTGYNDSIFFGASRYHEVLRDVNIDIYPGEILGLIGSSGCGKTTLTRVLTGLISATNGTITENGRIMADFSQRKKMKRCSVGLVFQDPYNSLNPAKTISWLLEEPLRIHGICDRIERKTRVLQMLSDVGLGSKYQHYYPHQLSGGQRQRVALAVSLMLSPSLIIADEPVSALDASVQAQILELLFKINREKGVAFLFISHNLSVVRSICHRVAIMDDGRIVESGAIDEVFDKPSTVVASNFLKAETNYHPRSNRTINSQ